jgi:hypothetical protein
LKILLLTWKRPQLALDTILSRVSNPSTGIWKQKTLDTNVGCRALLSIFDKTELSASFLKDKFTTTIDSFLFLLKSIKAYFYHCWNILVVVSKTFAIIAIFICYMLISLQE